MPSKEQLKGVILEEIVLYLLQKSGYDTVLEPGNDPTIVSTAAGLAVRGRGCLHQIDAIADFTMRPPFSHPSRLLVETKCYDPGRPVGLAVIRNGAGVLKDVNEYWTEAHGARKRFHYQYAVVSTSPFTREAQAYAFAQDVYLLPLGASAYLGSLLVAIDRAAAAMLDAAALQTYLKTMGAETKAASVSIAEVRSILRHLLQPLPERGFVPRLDITAALEMVFRSMHHLGALFVGVLAGGIPLLLAPASDAVIQRLQDDLYMRLERDDSGMLLVSVPDGVVRFSFDLPADLFLRFEALGRFIPPTQYRGEWEPEIDVYVTTDERRRVVKIRLERGWVETVEEWAVSVETASELERSRWSGQGDEVDDEAFLDFKDLF